MYPLIDLEGLLEISTDQEKVERNMTTIPRDSNQQPFPCQPFFNGRKREVSKRASSLHYFTGTKSKQSVTFINWDQEKEVKK